MPGFREYYSFWREIFKNRFSFRDFLRVITEVATEVHHGSSWGQVRCTRWCVSFMQSLERTRIKCGLWSKVSSTCTIFPRFDLVKTLPGPRTRDACQIRPGLQATVLWFYWYWDGMSQFFTGKTVARMEQERIDEQHSLPHYRLHRCVHPSDPDWFKGSGWFRDNARIARRLTVMHARSDPYSPLPKPAEAGWPYGILEDSHVSWAPEMKKQRHKTALPVAFFCVLLPLL